ncbi:MAG: hypothetical protein R2772_06295 [Chitinophagales bacterium]
MNENLNPPAQKRKKVKNIEEFNIGLLIHSINKSLVWALFFLVVSVLISLFYLRQRNLFMALNL